MCYTMVRGNYMKYEFKGIGWDYTITTDHIDTLARQLFRLLGPVNPQAYIVLYISGDVVMYDNNKEDYLIGELLSPEEGFLFGPNISKSSLPAAAYD